MPLTMQVTHSGILQLYDTAQQTEQGLLCEYTENPIWSGVLQSLLRMR